MSKIAGIRLGDPNEPFQVFGTQLGGRDEAIVVHRPSANIRREQVDAVAKYLNSAMKDIAKAIEQLSVMEEMMTVDEDTDSVVLDKNFVERYSEAVALVKEKFEEIITAVQN